MRPARLNRLRRAITYGALAALLSIVTVMLSQCTMIGERLTGVSLDRSQRASCIGNCKDARDACLVQAAHDCGGTEGECYRAAAALCQEQFQACKNNCHKQGGGNAG